MKHIRKISILLLSMLMIAVFCAAAHADVILAPTPEQTEAAGEQPGEDAILTVGESDPKTDEDSAGDTAADTAETTGQSEAGSYNVGLFVTDGEGKALSGGGLLSCMGGGVNLMIKKDYVITAKYYDAKGNVYETTDNLILGVETDSEYVELDHNTINLKAAPAPYNFALRLLNPKAESGEDKLTLGVKRFKVEFSDILVAAVGVYLIVSAVRGSGSLFNDEFIKDEKKDQFKRLMRLVCVVIGVVFLISAALAICFSYLDPVVTARYVLFGIGIIGLVLMVVLNSVFTDKEKRAKARESYGGVRPHASNAAFEFDGTEPTLDEVLADIENEKQPENKE